MRQGIPADNPLLLSMPVEVGRSQQFPRPPTSSVVGVGKHAEPVELHDPLVAEFGASELAFSYEALHRLGMDIQNLGRLKYA